MTEEDDMEKLREEQMRELLLKTMEKIKVLKKLNYSKIKKEIRRRNRLLLNVLCIYFR